MRRYLMSLIVAAALVAGLTACRTYEHPNGCVQILDLEISNMYLAYIDEFMRPRVNAWETLEGYRIGYTQQEDVGDAQATIWTTIACAQQMDPYPPGGN